MPAEDAPKPLDASDPQTRRTSMAAEARGFVERYTDGPTGIVMWRALADLEVVDGALRPCGWIRG